MRTGGREERWGVGICRTTEGERATESASASSSCPRENVQGAKLSGVVALDITIRVLVPIRKRGEHKLEDVEVQERDAG